MCKRDYRLNDGRLLGPDEWRAMSADKTSWYTQL
jgi:hypothetical protein